ncbi:MAG TPA: YqgE/AlgH family protein [Burkholderiales bacterium]|nr:YqgE/AlgH family protein [Burkholderiales bacterium]
MPQWKDDFHFGGFRAGKETPIVVAMPSPQTPLSPRRGLIVAAVLFILVLVGAALYLKPLSRGAHAAAHSPPANDLSRPMLLVAAPKIEDPIYGGAIIVATPLDGDRHVGFIVNWPTAVALSDAYPSDGPAQELGARLYVGGPFLPQTIFALVRRSTSPAGKSLELAPGLYAALDRTAVEEVMRVNGADARYVVGLVVWLPQELQREIDAGTWYVLKANPESALQSSDEDLWDEFVRRAREAPTSIHFTGKGS